MSLIRRGFHWPTLGHWMDDFVGGDSFFPSHAKELTPAVNIKETDKAFEVELATPGFKRDDISIEVHDGVLNISAENKIEKEEKDKKKGSYTRREFQYNSFQRSFTLPEHVDQDHIEANYKDGILELKLAKTDEVKKPEARKVAIKS